MRPPRPLVDDQHEGGGEVVICMKCRADVLEKAHALGCPVTRRVVDDEELARILIRKGVV